MALKDFQAPLDSPDPSALLDLRASLVLLKAQERVFLDCLEPLASEESRATQDSKASEVTLVTVAVLEEVPQGCLGYLEFQELTAALDSLDEKVNLVMVVPQA